MAADAAIEDMDCGIWDRAFTLNVRGTMLMIKHCVHSMIEMGHGSIINIGSGVSVLGDLFNPAYSTSKGAVNTLTRNVAASLANEAFDAMPFFRSEEHTSELQSLMRTSYAGFCLKKKKLDRSHT